MPPFLLPPIISTSKQPTTAASTHGSKRLRLSMLLLLVAFSAHAQGPTVVRTFPDRNSTTAPPFVGVAVEFDQFLSDSLPTLQALSVFSHQSGGKRAGSPVVVNSRLGLLSNKLFRAGETAFATVTTGVQNRNLQNLAKPFVFQFNIATAPSSAVFRSRPDVPLGNLYGITVGDIDGDNDLDLLAANQVTTGTTSTVSVRLNAGDGTFTNGQEISGTGTGNVRLGDLNGDGTLDLIATDGVRLNYGGVFGEREAAGLGGHTLGDIDGDGDLDLLTEGTTTNSPTRSPVVRVRLNDGNANFSESQLVPVAANSANVVLGDVNNDGALDLIASSISNGSISVRLNDGLGTFASSGQQLSIATMQEGLLLGDVDADGDLDLAAVNSGSTVTILLNNGQGTFSESSYINLGSYSVFGKFGDVDGDGDLDLLAGGPPNSVSVRLNDGQGNFSGEQAVIVNDNPRTLAVGDLDNDGTLDFVTAASPSLSGGSASVRLNSRTEPLVVYKIKAGAGRVESTRGTFSGDQYFSPLPGNTFATNVAIEGTIDDELYQTERYGQGAVFSYALPLPNNQYLVTLHFAEIYWDTPGQRLFDVTAEGTKVLDDYDILRKVAPNTATTETFLVTVTDGELNLDFSALAADGGIDNPKLAALEVVVPPPGAVAQAPAKTAKQAAGVQALLEAYPNPFSTRTNLHWRIAETGFARLQVYNLFGQLVATPFEGRVEAGHDYKQLLAAKGLQPGTYICRLQLNGKNYTQRLVVSQ
ncbi:FG-GAP-like repeat-containing protein [Hymenobacter sp. YC55]|uniref:FG-GAP-like repeat-containing protein n=1 Tax=Hymenobacter sp. YC55 TaxID=3034019 RepID=UPI0023F9C947|nr:FG-GAP-like repeat-containing protein [Hymenobacter sp. YC55]MDF7814855.1 FG-GAP-like repeat-containing protein [Hymenobacter sp. YC55]